MTYNDGNDDHRYNPRLIALWALLLLFAAGALIGFLCGAAFAVWAWL